MILHLFLLLKHRSAKFEVDRTILTRLKTIREIRYGRTNLNKTLIVEKNRFIKYNNIKNFLLNDRKKEIIKLYKESQLSDKKKISGPFNIISSA